MKVLILAVFLVCALAQPYDYNLCDLTVDCTATNAGPCADGNPNYPFIISDRSGYSCDQTTKKCVAPQCSMLSFGIPDSFAPTTCSSGSYCSNHACVTIPVQPQPEPQPQPSGKTILNVNIGFANTAGMAGDPCTTSTDCIGYCNAGKCADKIAFSPLCPQSCTIADSCLEGTCIGGQCVRTSYKRNLGAKCEGNTECFSGQCAGGYCVGVDCTNFGICQQDGYWCDYSSDFQNNPTPVCFPDYDTFIATCDPKTSYAERVDNQTVKCTAKKGSDSSCVYDVECTSAWCYSGKCSAYPMNSIPEGAYCAQGLCVSGLKCTSQKICSKGIEGSNCNIQSDCGANLLCNSSFMCSTGKQGVSCVQDYDCQTGLYCNRTSNTYQCAPQVPEGGMCSVTSDCQSNLDLFCQYDSASASYICGKSTTIGQPCAWDMQGTHNCSYSNDETCACFAAGTGSNVPRCVSVDSKQYLDQYDKYIPVPVTPAPPDNSLANAYALINEAQTKGLVCQLDQFGIDYDTYNSLSSILQSSYVRSRSDNNCNYQSSFNQEFNNPKCLPEYAKYYCCYMCSGLLDGFLALYPDIPRDEKIFHSQILGPIISVTCGGPTFNYNPDSCSGIQLYSINDILNQLDCGGAPKAVFQQVTVTIAVPAGTDTSSATNAIKQIVIDTLNSQSAPQPTLINVFVDPITGSIVVQLIYSGDKNSQSNVQAGSQALQSDSFKSQVAQTVPDSTVSDVQTQSSSAGTIMFSTIALIALIMIGLLF